MAFVTKVDYSDNRQVKQFQLSNTNLSGATQFGVSYSALTGGVDESTIVTTGTLSGITSTFSGNTEETNFYFDDARLNSGVETIDPITRSNSNESQVGQGFTGIDPIIIDGNVVYQNYTGSTYDLTVTSIVEVSTGEFTGTTISDTVTLMSGDSKDFSERTIWVDVKGITRTEKMILLDEPEVDDTLTTSLSRNIEGEIRNVKRDFITGYTYNPNTNTFLIEKGGDKPNLSATIGAVSGLTVNGGLSATTVNTNRIDAESIFSGGTQLSLLLPSSTINDNDFVTGATFNDLTGVLGIEMYSGNTITTNLDGRYSLTSHTHQISDITDFPTDISYFNNDVGYITGFTNTFVTDFTYNDSNVLTINRNNGQSDLLVDIGIMSGLTVNGSISSENIESTTVSATTYLNLPEDNNYVTGTTFDTSTGDLTLSTLSGNTIIENLDGRYSLTGHTHEISDITDFPTNVSFFNNDVGYITGFTNTTYTAGSGLDLNGTEFSHSDTSNVSSTNNAGRTYIQNIDLDGFGHITGLTTSSESVINTDDYVTGSTFNTSTGDLTLTTLSGNTIVENLDGRYLTNETDNQTLNFNKTNGELSISNGNTVDLDGRYSLTGHTHQISDITDFPTNISFFNNDIGYITGFTDTTYTNGVGLDLNGTEFSHSDTSSQASSNNTGRSYIQNIDLDDFGHITGLTTNTETVINTDDYVNNTNFNTSTGDLTLTTLSGNTIVESLDGRYSLTGHTHVIADITDFPTDVSFFNNDVGYITGFTDTTYTAGSGLDLNGTEFSHSDTSNVSSTNNIDRTYIQNIDLDGFGHITGLTTSTETVVNTDDYITTANFSVSTGHLTLSTLSGNTIVENLDGRYSLTGHTHQISDINDFPTDVSYFNNDIGYITGFTNTFVTDFTYNNSNTLTISRNNGEPDLSVNISIMSGLTVNGDVNAENVNTTTVSATTYLNLPEDANDYVTNSNFNTSTGDLSLTTLSGNTIVENLDGRYLTGFTIPSTYLESGDDISELNNDVGYITGFTDTNFYLNNLTFNTSSGVLTAEISGATNQTVDLDGRYSLTGHTHVISDITDFPTDISFFNNDVGYITGFTNTTYTSGSGLDLNGTEFSHSDTSNVSSTNNSGRTYIQNIDLDTFGHITGLTTSSESVINTDDYVTGSTFNTSTGDLTLTTLSGNTIIENLDGRYLTDYQTLNFNKTNGELSISDSNTVDLDGRYSLTGHTHVISDITDFPTDVSFFNNDVGYITGFTNTFVTDFSYNNSNTLTINRNNGEPDLSVNIGVMSGLTVNGSISSDNVESTTVSATTYLNLPENTNDYITSSTFNTLTGDLTLSTLSGNTIVENLDGRYSLTGHTHQISDITDFPTDVSFFNNDVGYITGFTNTTYTNGVGLDLNGTEFRHSDTSNVSSTNNVGRTYIQNISLDTFGHITGLTTSNETVVNTDNYVTSTNFNKTNGDLTLSTLSGNTIVENLDGRYSLTGHTHEISNITDFPTNVSFFNNDVGYITGFTNTTYTAGAGLELNGTEFSHSDTSSQASSNNTGRTYIQNIDLDTFGHITGLTTNTETVINTDDYVIDSKFNASTGDLTLTTLSGNTIVENLDGRYSLTGHTHEISDIIDFPTDVSFFNNDVGYITGFTNTTYSTNLINSTGDVIIRLSGSDNSIDDITLVGGSNITLNTSGDTLTINSIAEDTTYTAGSGLDLNNTEFSHSDTSNQVSTNNTGRSYIQNIDLDNFGHITGLTTSSETVVNTDDYITATNFNISTGDLTLTTLSGNTIIENLDGRYLTDYQTLNFNKVNGELSISNGNTVDLDGRYSLTGHTHVISDITDFPTDVSFFNNDIGYITGFTDTTYTAGSGLDLNGTEFRHSDTSTLSNTNNSGRTYIQNIDLDTFGHITGLTTSTETFVNTDDYVTATDFNTSTGNLTLSTLSGNTIIENLDGRYSLTGHTHVISDITDFPTNISFFNNDVGYITGFTNTFVSDFTYNNSNVLTIERNGGQADLSVNIGVMSGLTVNGNVSAENIETTTVSATTYLNLPEDANDYVTNSTFNTSTGDLTLTTLSGNTIIENLDGRYSLLTHNHTISDITDFPTDISFFNNDVGYITGFTNTTYTAGSGLDLNNTEFSHSDTSNVSSTNNSGRTYIQNIDLDGFGHITGLTTSTETVVNTDDYVTGSTFNTSTGDLTLSTLSGNTIVENLDGRYIKDNSILSDYLFVDKPTRITINNDIQDYYKRVIDDGGVIENYLSVEDFISTDDNSGTQIKNIELDVDGNITDIELGFLEVFEIPPIPTEKIINYNTWELAEW